MKSGVDARKTTKVSTLAYCSVLMLAKTHARKAIDTGRNAFSLFHSRSSTTMQPQQPTSLTAAHELKSWQSSTNDGAGSTCTATLFITSMSDEHVA